MNTKFRAANVLILLPALALGGFLRLYMLPDQILLDDEWHMLNYVIGKNYGEVAAMSPGFGATSAPFNLYALLLLKTVGWSESWLRLPSVAAGLLGLIVLPPLVWRIFGRRTAFIFSLLLAISPFLVFYSRVARPYAAVALLGGLSTLAFWHWAFTQTRANWRWALVSVLTGIFAIWLHPFAAVGVLSPIAWGLANRMFTQWRARSSSGSNTLTSKAPTKQNPNLRRADKKGEDVSLPGSWPKMAHLAFLLPGIAVPSALLLLPAILHPQESSLMVSAGRGHFKLALLAGTSEITWGTSILPLGVLLAAVALVGLGRLCWKSPFIGGAMVMTLAAYAAAFGILKPADMHAPIVTCRYAILVLPILMIAAAFGLETITQALKLAPSRGSMTLFYATGTVLCGGLLLGGPLLRVYRGENSFTNHSAFQESYRPAPTDHFYVSQFMPLRFPLNRANAPAYYSSLATHPEIKTVLEYPMVLGDHMNLLYFYQQIHGKRVMIGYLPREVATEISMNRERTKNEAVYGNDNADVVLKRVTNKSQLRFRNMVDLTDPKELSASGADVLVLHKDLVTEWSARRGAGVPSPIVQRLALECEKLYGPPVFADNQLIVFNLKSRTSRTEGNRQMAGLGFKDLADFEKALGTLTQELQPTEPSTAGFVWAPPQ